jgi:hypothetical protein
VRAWGAEYVIERRPEALAALAPLLHDDAIVETQSGCIGDEKRVATLVSELLASADGPQVRAFKEAAALDASLAPADRGVLLGGLGPDSGETVRRAVEALLGVPGEHRVGALEALSTAHVERTTAMVKPFLGSHVQARTVPFSEALAAVHALSVSGDATATTLLLALTLDPREEIRRAAAAGYIASPFADPAIVSTLELRYLDGSHLATDIAAIATPRALAWLDAHGGYADGLPRRPPREACAWLRAKITRAAADVRHVRYPTDEFTHCATRDDLPVLRAVAPDGAWVTTLGEAKDVEAFLARWPESLYAADRLYWLGAKDAVPQLRALAETSAELELVLVADDLEGVRRPVFEHERLSPVTARVRIAVSNCMPQPPYWHGLAACYDKALSLDPGARGVVEVAMGADAQMRARSWTTSRALALCTAAHFDLIGSVRLDCPVRVEYLPPEVPDAGLTPPASPGSD